MAVFIGLSKGKCLEEFANNFESYKIFLAEYVTNHSKIYFTGVRSYGKVVYLFFFLKFTGFLIFAAKVIDVLPLNTFRFWIEKTEWMEFIYNGEVCYYPYTVRN